LMGFFSRGKRKAVSDRFISAAIDRKTESAHLCDRRQTAAGLPSNGLSVNASTMYRGAPLLLSFFINSLLSYFAVSS
jgi:hypothetical protein